MTDLAEDISGLASKMAEYATKSDRNAARLARLERELQTFYSALRTLKQDQTELEIAKERHAS